MFVHSFVFSGRASATSAKLWARLVADIDIGARKVARRDSERLIMRTCAVRSNANVELSSTASVHYSTLPPVSSKRP